MSYWYALFFKNMQESWFFKKCFLESVKSKNECQAYRYKRYELIGAGSVGKLCRT